MAESKDMEFGSVDTLLKFIAVNAMTTDQIAKIMGPANKRLVSAAIDEVKQVLKSESNLAQKITIVAENLDVLQLAAAFKLEEQGKFVLDQIDFNARDVMSSNITDPEFSLLYTVSLLCGSKAAYEKIRGYLIEVNDEARLIDLMWKTSLGIFMSAINGEVRILHNFTSCFSESDFQSNFPPPYFLISGGGEGAMFDNMIYTIATRCEGEHKMTMLALLATSNPLVLGTSEVPGSVTNAELRDRIEPLKDKILFWRDQQKVPFDIMLEYIKYDNMGKEKRNALLNEYESNQITLQTASLRLPNDLVRGILDFSGTSILLDYRKSMIEFGEQRTVATVVSQSEAKQSTRGTGGQAPLI